MLLLAVVNSPAAAREHDQAVPSCTAVLVSLASALEESVSDLDLSYCVICCNFLQALGE